MKMLLNSLIVKQFLSIFFKNRFRRRRSTETEAEPTTTRPEILNAEVFEKLDIDEDTFIHIVEWSLEGGSLKDFNALVADHDKDGKREGF